MIHYQLRCGAGHEFDGWFQGSAAFETQAERGLLACPRCGDVHVVRALMAPRIGKGGPGKDASGKGEPAAPEPQPVSEPQPAAEQAAPGPQPGRVIATLVPDEMRALLSRMRSEIEQRCDYVGRDFAAEARRIHHGDAPARGIYGEAGPGEAEALAEDGIEIARIPWVPRADS